MNIIKPTTDLVGPAQLEHVESLRPRLLKFGGSCMKGSNISWFRVCVGYVTSRLGYWMEDEQD